MKKLPHKIISCVLAASTGTLSSCATYPYNDPRARHYEEYSRDEPPAQPTADNDNSDAALLALLGLGAVLFLSDFGSSSQSNEPVKESPPAPTYTIGRMDDTGAFRNRRFERLDIPNWTPRKNDKFVDQIIEEQAAVHIASDINRSTLVTSEGEPTVFAKELKQFEDANYTRVGSNLYPPRR